MTTEEIKSIEDIQGTGGFRVIQYLISEKMKELESVNGIDLHSASSVGEQALARKLACELLTKFLIEINLSSPTKVTRRTYE